jgi:hypothetical protein
MCVNLLGTLLLSCDICPTFFLFGMRTKWDSDGLKISRW